MITDHRKKRALLLAVCPPTAELAVQAWHTHGLERCQQQRKHIDFSSTREGPLHRRLVLGENPRKFLKNGILFLSIYTAMAVYIVAHGTAYGKQSRAVVCPQGRCPQPSWKTCPPHSITRGEQCVAFTGLRYRSNRHLEKRYGQQPSAVWFPKERPFSGRERRVKVPQLPQPYLV